MEWIAHTALPLRQAAVVIQLTAQRSLMRQDLRAGKKALTWVGDDCPKGAGAVGRNSRYSMRRMKALA